MQLGPLSFRPVLALGPVQGANAEGPIVKYRVLDQSVLRESRGVYVVAAGNQVMYRGKYTNSFSKRWLYARLGYVYHFKRNEIAAALAQGH
jgi:hypothetical protein